MARKEIYLIRHGQTDCNLNGIVQGSGVDAPLNETGLAQASAFYEAHKHLNFDKVYISTLQRTRQSVGKFLDDGIPHEALPGLNEISWGKREGQPFSPEENVYYRTMLEKWKSGEDDFRIEGGESPRDVQVRLQPAIESIVNAPGEQLILICMHGRAMKILLCTILNYPLSEMDRFPHENLGLYKLQFTGDLFRVELFNSTDHLA